MNIEFTKEQYKDLIAMVALGNGIVGILGDVLPDTDYKKRSHKTEKLENYLVQFADEFGVKGIADKETFEDRVVLDDDYFGKKIMPVIFDYEDFATHDTLSKELAMRDFRNDHTEEEIKKMSEESGGYLGVETFDYEKKYWDEFDEYGFERLEIVEVK